MNPTLSFTIDVDALAREGIPRLHAEAFAQVAQQENCIILTRVPGPACYDLLNEGYDAKSFHIKGKSCNWGPMAGFVCLDPLFNKSGIDGAVSNATAHKKALTDTYEDKTASCTPIRISAARLANLIRDKVVQVTEDGPERKVVKASYKVGAQEYGFLLLKQGDLWRLYYRLEDAYKVVDKPNANSLVKAFSALQPTRKLTGEETEAYVKVAETLLTAGRAAQAIEVAELKDRGKELIAKNYVPVMALTNPHAHYTNAAELYRNAVTGDYDLFALWPSVAGKDDQRVAGMSKGISNAAIEQAEKDSKKIGALVGNISDRIFLVAQLVNSIISDRKPQPNRVYHSDEGGRPFVQSVDLPVAVFLPAALAVNVPRSTPNLTTTTKDYRTAPHGHLVENTDKLVELIVACSANKYVIFVNKGWRAELENKRTGISKVLADSETFTPAGK